MEKILVVVDMQRDFTRGALGSKEAMSIVDNVVNKIRNFDGKIIVTYDTHYEDYMTTNEGKHLPVPHCIKGTDGWNLDEKIKDALSGKQYVCIEKNTFGSKKLPEIISRMLPKSYDEKCISIEFVGLCTDICVISNVFLAKAYYPEAEISVDAACCAGVTPESHNAALMTMKSCHINIYN